MCSVFVVEIRVMHERTKRIGCVELQLIRNNSFEKMEHVRVFGRWMCGNARLLAECVCV